jgi:hypothetical protein
MRSRVLVTGLALLFAGNLMAADKDDAFLIDKKQFKKQYRTIALTPVDADGYFDMPDRVAAIIEQEVTARLEKRGYKVIPSTVLAGIQKTMEEQVGGFKKPGSEEDDIAKVQAVRTHSFRELWFQEEFDAMANIRLSIFHVAMESDSVEWDGTEQKIQYEGRSKKYSAKIYVSSVSLAIYDPTFKQLFMNYGGLEPLMHRGGEQLEVLTNEHLFKDEKKIREAVKIALDPF